MGPMAPGNQPPIPYTPKNGHLLRKTLHFRQHYATCPFSHMRQRLLKHEK